MSILEIIVRCSALVILSGFLLYKRRQRECEWRPKPQDPAHWNGRSLDLTPVKPAVERLRQNNFVVSRSAVREGFRRQDRVAHARQVLGCLAYFCDGKTKKEAQEAPPLT